MPVKPRLVIIGNSLSIASTVLLQALLGEMRNGKAGMELEGVFDGAIRPPEPLVKKVGRKVILPAIRRLFDSRRKIVLRRPLTDTIYHVAGRFGHTVQPLPNRDVNHPDTIAWLSSLKDPVVLISLGVLQIYRPPILDAVHAVVNYHNGALPFYKGLHANSWELYRRESSAGYTFHYMDPHIDAGNILLQGRLPADQAPDPLILEYEKAYRAAADMGRLLDKVRRFDPGIPQPQAGNYFSEIDFQRIRTIDNPSDFTYEELLHRIRCFDMIYLALGNKCWRVTRIDKLGSNTGNEHPLQFTTKDPIRAMATRISFLPYKLRPVGGWSGGFDIGIGPR
jgi:methionyl-tRNA formyltransferase